MHLVCTLMNIKIRAWSVSEKRDDGAVKTEKGRNAPWQVIIIRDDYKNKVPWEILAESFPIAQKTLPGRKSRNRSRGHYEKGLLSEGISRFSNIFKFSGISPENQRLGNENSAWSFSDRSFWKPPWGHGRPRLWVMDVRTDMLVFPGFRGRDRSFCPRMSAGISARMSAGYPAPKLTLWAAFSFLKEGLAKRKHPDNPLCKAQ